MSSRSAAAGGGGGGGGGGSAKEAAAAALHEASIKAANDVLQQREPVASAVLAWGWLLKQVRGDGRHCGEARGRRAASGGRRPEPPTPRCGGC